jgi:hypothetical protein
MVLLLSHYPRHPERGVINTHSSKHVRAALNDMPPPSEQGCVEMPWWQCQSRALHASSGSGLVSVGGIGAAALLRKGESHFPDGSALTAPLRALRVAIDAL